MAMTRAVRQYAIVTGSYWAFTLTDGALRMLVVLYFHNLGYSPLEVAMLFLFYEFFGVVTNLVGGWLAARLGLNVTQNIGLALQVSALGMLLVEASFLSVAYVMAAQALSGIAKDLNKMSAKSSIKLLVPEGKESKLYQWVAALTGSKNALKGVGFFLGGLLLTGLGFRGAILCLAILLIIVLLITLMTLDQGLGKTRYKPKFTELLSKSASVNWLSAARFFLFGSRDVWFVVALPVYLQSELGWGHIAVGTLLALWVIGYGVVQSQAPKMTGTARGVIPDGRTTERLALALSLIPGGIAGLLFIGIQPDVTLIVGLLIFGAVFAVNSSVHSFLIVLYARSEGVSLDIGFYYMANALGRLVGTVLSGIVYQVAGLQACLLVSMVFVLAAYFISIKLPDKSRVSV